MLSVLPDDAGFLTAGVEVSFHAPLVPGKVFIQATLTDLADRHAVVEVQFKQRDRVCVKAQAKQIILRGYATPIKQD
jgi:acyl-coenzyme A thioesterase PaaI-like protein